MKGLILFLAGAATALICVWLVSGGAAFKSTVPERHTFSSFDPPNGNAAAKQFDSGALNLADADLEQVLNLYQEVSARTVIRGSGLPKAKISLHNQTALNRVETLQLLDTTLAQNGVTMVLAGDASVKAVPSGEAPAETPPMFDPAPDALPDSSSYMTCTVQLKDTQGKELIDLLAPVSRMPRSIIYMPKRNLLMLRDYSANIRQMLRLIKKLDESKQQ